MKASIVNVEKDQVVYQLSDCTQAELNDRINSFFISEGYKHHSGQGEIRTYTKGDRTMRILFGALVTYFKQNVIVKKEGSDFSVVVPKSPSGISGGTAGRNQAKKEFARINEALKTHLNGSRPQNTAVFG